MASLVKAGEIAKKTTITASPTRVEITSPYFADRESAVAFASVFPKSVRAGVSSISGMKPEDGRGTIVHFVYISAVLHPTAATGAENEVGSKRIRRAAAILRKRGVEIVPRIEFASDLSVAEIRRLFLS